jgi:hypothetical protein
VANPKVSSVQVYATSRRSPIFQLTLRTANPHCVPAIRNSGTSKATFTRCVSLAGSLISTCPSGRSPAVDTLQPTGSGNPDRAGRSIERHVRVRSVDGWNGPVEYAVQEPDGMDRTLGVVS